MIKSVTVTNHRNESLTINISDPYSSGFAITGITGLNPPTASINTTDLVTGDGSVYNSARIEPRNIVISFKYLSDTSVEAIREKSYTYFPIKQKVHLTFVTDLRTCGIDGYVESNEATIFSSMTTGQVSIICPSPYLYSTTNDENVFSGTTSEFEFMIAPEYSSSSTYAIGDLCIYSNQLYICTIAVSTAEAFDPLKWSLKTLTDNEIGTIEFPVNDPIPFSIVNQDTVKSITYSGEIDTGIIIRIHVLNSVTGIRIWNYYTGEAMSFDSDKITQVTGGALQTGDDIEISTIKGSKYVTLTRSGTTYNILNCINKDADWFQISLGENVFCYTATTGIYNIQLSIENPVLIQGI